MSRIKLWLAKTQETSYIAGADLLAILSHRGQVLNACVLDFLLENPLLVPREWEGKTVFFWGTIYSREDGWYAVRCLALTKGKVVESHLPICEGVFYKENPAALLVDRAVEVADRQLDALR